MYFFVSFLTVNIVMGVFVAINVNIAFGRLFAHRLPFLLAVFLFTQFYWLTRLVGRRLDIALPSFIFYIASCALAVFLLAVLTIVFADFIVLLARAIPPLKPLYQFLKTHPVQVGFVVLALVAAQFIWGYYRAHTPRFTQYSLTLPVKEDLRIIHLSDLHVSSFTSTKFLNNLIDKINGQRPDLIFITGDIIDSDLSPYLDKKVGDIFLRLESKYGVYASMGNHDYYGGDWREAEEAFEASGMTVLIDKMVQLDEAGITLIGRDDYSSRRFRENGRASLESILANNDRDYPLLIIDHQPRALAEAISNKASLQLSGHTHNGQIFPANLLIAKLYKKGWGLLEENGFSLIVTCGVGTWGPPVRTNSYSEIVIVDVKKQ